MRNERVNFKKIWNGLNVGLTIFSNLIAFFLKKLAQFNNVSSQRRQLFRRQYFKKSQHRPLPDTFFLFAFLANKKLFSLSECREYFKSPKSQHICTDGVPCLAFATNCHLLSNYDWHFLFNGCHFRNEGLHNKNAGDTLT
jgi:hypothetical protein